MSNLAKRNLIIRWSTTSQSHAPQIKIPHKAGHRKKQQTGLEPAMDRDTNHIFFTLIDTKRYERFVRSISSISRPHSFNNLFTFPFFETKGLPLSETTLKIISSGIMYSPYSPIQT